MTTPPADGMPTTRGLNFFVADPNLDLVCATVMAPADLARTTRPPGGWTRSSAIPPTRRWSASYLFSQAEFGLLTTDALAAEPTGGC
jgi:hypothetical protein